MKNLGTITNDKDVPTKKFVEDNAGGGGGDFEVVYGTTTSAEIEAAYQAKKTCKCVYGNLTYYLAYRNGATYHMFTVVYNTHYYRITCNNNTWTNADADLAKINSPAFTGQPSAPTPNEGDDSTKLATTEFVMDVVGDIAAALEALL